MINNRQNGRRRGRGGGGGGGQRQGGGGGGGQRDSGNRIDSRARGNANQLLEKYRNMARDAQMSGDRVNTEYYLQFADHYFRVLMDQRGRQEEQGQQRRPRNDFDPFDDGDDFDPDFGGEGEQIRADEQPRASEGERPRRDHRDGRGEDARNAARGDRGEDRREKRDDRGPRSAAPPANDLDEPASAAEPTAEEAPRRRGRPRRVRGDEDQASTTEPSIDAATLPPSIGVIASPEEAEDAPKPRRRRRTATADAPQDA